MCKQNPQGNDCWDCYIFQDADLVPENDRNYYRCGPEPTRLFSAADEFANYGYEWVEILIWVEIFLNLAYKNLKII